MNRLNISRWAAGLNALLILHLLASKSIYPEPIPYVKVSSTPPRAVRAQEIPGKKRQTLAEEYYRAGVVAYIKGDNAKALSYFERILKIQPDHALAKNQIEKIKQETNEKKLTEAREKYNQGIAHYMKGELEQSVSLWEQALLLDPYNPKIQKALDRARAELRERKIP